MNNRATTNGGFSIPVILLVEDDDNDAFGIELAFKKLHLQGRIRRVMDGAHAIDYLEGNPPYDDRSQNPPPSLLLVDLHMPRKDGFDLLKWVRGHAAYKHLPTVILTGSDHDADIKKALDLGANSYLVKPKNFFDFTQMLELLDSYWKMHHVPQSPEMRQSTTPAQR